jgi:hypothetical protein
MTWEVVNHGRGENALVWRWEQYFLPKLWYIFARLYGVTAQEIAL